MWTKIYLIVLTVAVLPLMFLYYYSSSWLKSIGAPAAAVEGFGFYSDFAWNYLWIAFLGLLIIANILLWKTRKAWALWTTLAYFTVFVTARYFWLDTQLSSFKRSNGFEDSGVTLGIFMGVIYIFLCAVMIYFNQFILLRLSEKMHPPPESYDPLDVKSSEDSENEEIVVK